MFKRLLELINHNKQRKSILKQSDVIRLRLEQYEMNEWQKTDVVLSWNLPFMTLTESKMPNVWYHEHFNWLCKYTPDGFKPELKAFGGSKKNLFERGFGRCCS